MPVEKLPLKKAPLVLKFDCEPQLHVKWKWKLKCFSPISIFSRMFDTISPPASEARTCARENVAGRKNESL